MITAEPKIRPGLHNTGSHLFGKSKQESFFSTATDKTGFFGPGAIQPKLEIGAPDDEYEKEADQVADAVMRMPDPKIQRKCKKCEEEEKLQKKSVGTSGPGGRNYAGSEISNEVGTSSGRGNQLPEDVQLEMEQKMGADFSGVTIHAGSDAHHLNRQLGARAFTHGRDIYFSDREYNPQSVRGKHLLAHELTHVLQQGVVGGQRIQRDGNSTESTDAGHDNSFDFDFSLLPTSLKFTLGNWMLQANTGRTELQFSQNLLRYSLGYNYGGSIFAGINRPGFSTRLGVDPTSGETSLSMRYGQFRLGGSYNPDSTSFGLNFGYGSPLLPMPGALSQSIYGGWAGASSILGSLGSMQDPISFYQSHRSDIREVMGAVRALQPMFGAQHSGFGAGLKFNYNPHTGILLYGGMQWLF